MADQIITKRCSHCKQTKPLSDFHKDRSTKNGLRVACKTCVKAYSKTENHKANLKQYNQSEKGKAYQRRYCQSKRGKNVQKTHQRRYNKKHPEQQKARRAVNQAIRDGKFPKAKTFKCSCGLQAEQYHHHKGYKPEHWFHIVPTCKNCHKKFHKPCSGI